MTIVKIHQQVLTSKPTIKAQFLAEVQFGIPSNNCANYGICRLVPFGNNPKEKLCAACMERKCLGIITIFKHKHVEMDFLKKDISAALYKKHFTNQTFEVQEKFYYQNPLFEITIEKGNYPIIENNSLIKVIFHKVLV